MDADSVRADDQPEVGAESGPALVEVPEQARPTDRRVLAGVLGMTVLALVARVLWLGERSAHWSEARLGYAVLTAVETGVWTYRPVMHGPLLAHANELLFSVFGPSDAIGRLTVAVVGGLLPLAAWLFRERLRDVEVLALAGFLAVNPVLLYYSRFARSNLLVAALALVTLGFLVRLADTRSPWYLYATALTGALAVAAKENALLYVAMWVGAGALVLDHRALVRPLDYDPVDDGIELVPEWLLGRIDGAVVLVALLNPVVVTAFVESRFVTIVSVLVALRATRWVLPEGGDWHRLSTLTGAVAVVWLLTGIGSAALVYAVTWAVFGSFVLGEVLRGSSAGQTLTLWRAPLLLAGTIVVVATIGFYAPRGDAGLGAALTNPVLLPGVVEAALFESWDDMTALYFGNVQTLSFLDSFAFFATALRGGAFVLVLFAVVGFLADRYGAGEQRDLVAFASYWGFASVLAYPVLVAVQGQWALVHMVVPLAIPAAVGLGLVGRWGWAAVGDRRTVSASLAVAVLLFATGLTGATAISTVYASPAGEGNPLVQAGQPGTDLGPVAAAIETAASQNTDGPDVVYYGAFFAMDNESAADRLPVTDGEGWRNGTWTVYADNENWYHRLPLAWYVAQADAETASARTISALQVHLASQPPVVVTRATHANHVGELLGEGYQRHAVNLTATGTETVVFVNNSVQS
ncbi:flippase activity-associated protein Agl23 [Haloarchaeobius sp. DYHT-AS-18]|uniref:flippase activity-associated protein Agl23 n=1 Tax=Haloarchaeobius sp. DYHT-AS-18 TaxID=3446117 RepID=UPI003EBBCC95